MGDDERQRTLRALLTLRERDEAEAQARLGEAQRAERRAGERTAELRDQLSAIATADAAAGPASEATASSAFALQQATRYRRGRARQAAELRQRLQEAELQAREMAVQLEQARQTLAQRHAERRALQRRHAQGT